MSHLPYGQNFRLATAAPSASEVSLAQTTFGSTPPEPTWMPKPQSPPGTCRGFPASNWIAGGFAGACFGVQVA